MDDNVLEDIYRVPNDDDEKNDEQSMCLMCRESFKCFHIFHQEEVYKW